MLKLGRAQGVAIAAAIHRSVPIHEYAPLKIKMAITGNGSASKEQVAGMLQRMLQLKADDMPKFMDATKTELIEESFKTNNTQNEKNHQYCRRSYEKSGLANG